MRAATARRLACLASYDHEAFAIGKPEPRVIVKPAEVEPAIYRPAVRKETDLSSERIR